MVHRRRAATIAAGQRVSLTQPGSGRWRQRALAQLVTAVALIFVLSIPNTVVTAAPKGDRVYLALGDSLAAGEGATQPDRVGYVAHLAGFFHGTAHGGATRLVNLAMPGATTGSYISSGRLAQAVAVIDDSSDVIVVTLDIGSGNLLGLLAPGQPCATDPSTPSCQAAISMALISFVTTFPTILGEVAAALERDPGQEQLLVATAYNPLSGTGHPLDRFVERALLGANGTLDCGEPPAERGLNDWIACIASQYGATVVDLYPPFAGKAASLTHIRDNDVHPTNAGYAAIATAFRRATRAGD
jgi:lysophospholipase L1-like esterase